MKRWLFMMIWGSAIVILTAVSDFSSLIQDKPPQIMIAWDSQPNFSQLIELPKSFSQGYIIQKLGHIVCFFMLALAVRTSSMKARLILILFAFSTELLQLFTGRSGRLLDVGYDVIGIYLGLLLVKKPENVARYHLNGAREKPL
ncbi:VanZ family protein [Bacillus marasmi]|uniref:VanZ family protein n=1 Tax=Bacillus marasmi TaxID=1926279 RepID=UPI00164EBD6C|nr:VanZ family protein [Bacillus marasmi]